MYNAIFSEFLKVRRSKMLGLAMIASILPALVKFIQHVSGKGQEVVEWKWFLSSQQELMVLGMLISIILISSFIFSMEYQYSTITYIFTSLVSRSKVFIAKMILLFTIITSIIIVSVFSNLIFGYLTVNAGLPWDLFSKYLKVIAWYIVSSFLLSTLVVMVSILIKKFILSAVINLGYFMLVFPWHLKGNPYICPFMTPTVVAAKLFGSNDYIGSNYYKDISLNYLSVTMVLLVICFASFIIGMMHYKKTNAFS